MVNEMLPSDSSDVIIFAPDGTAAGGSDDGGVAGGAAGDDKHCFAAVSCAACTSLVCLLRAPATTDLRSTSIRILTERLLLFL